MVSEYSLVDGQSIIYFMSQYIFLDLLYARHAADAVGETGSKGQNQNVLRHLTR